MAGNFSMLGGKFWSNIPSQLKSPSTLKQIASTTALAVARQYMKENNIDIPLYYGGIYNKLTDTLIPILLPEEINRSHSTSEDIMTTEMRSVGLPFYTGGSNPTLSFSVYLNNDFYNAIIQQGLLTGDSVTDLIDQVATLTTGATINKVLACLRALTYPEYQAGRPIAPLCVLYLGESAKYLARCTSVSDTLKGITGLNSNYKPTHREAVVNLSFTIIKELTATSTLIPSASEIQGGVD